MFALTRNYSNSALDLYKLKLTAATKSVLKYSNKHHSINNESGKYSVLTDYIYFKIFNCDFIQSNNLPIYFILYNLSYNHVNESIISKTSCIVNCVRIQTVIIHLTYIDPSLKKSEKKNASSLKIRNHLSCFLT